MILKYLSSLKEIVPDPAWDSKKPLQSGDVVLGTLSGLALTLYHDSCEFGRTLQATEADLLDLRAKAVRSQKEEDFDAAEQKRLDMMSLCYHGDILTRLFRQELAEEFKVTEDNVCIGVRKGFQVVKYAGPPADGGRTLAGLMKEA